VLPGWLYRNDGYTSAWLKDSVAASLTFGRSFVWCLSCRRTIVGVIWVSSGRLRAFIHHV
jgi:hypothetical protein